MKFTRIMTIALVACTALFTSCFSQKKSQSSSAQSNIDLKSLTNTYWKLVSIDGKTVGSELIKEPFIQFESETNKMFGANGCNSFFGNYEIQKNGKIKFGEVGSTLMACLNGMEIENAFLGLLQKESFLSISNDKLIFKDKNNKEVAQFAKIEHKNLSGTWELEVYSAPPFNMDKMFPNKKPTLVFDLKENKISGNGGCNNFFGPIKIEGNKISIGDLVSTKMYCEGVEEQAFLTKLKEINRFYATEDGKNLSLFKGDLIIMQFTKK